ncbi:hypothetical protein E6C70_05935 [Glaciibacter flavus]|uniref:Hemagglutinin n=1 Tax=Orlajensenia flava TaxID=2565934 RepID=A0A4S4FYP7_9MICO|nr:hypothetical protein [Glaciibacter flavus]THG35578.1 hypothetical protein E6C70_05935 [Glaciibacter flavus]
MRAERRRPIPRRIVEALAATVIAIMVALALPGAPAASAAPLTTTPAPALLPTKAGTLPTDSGDFHAGRIISDYNFYNAYAMTEEQIGEFLSSLRCTPRDASPCLSDYRETTTDQPAQERGHCDAYRGGVDETAARIIARVSVACGISPRVLLVLLQKEQSLLTHPDARGYLRATGYACPDTADCDTKYFGFFNQVYNAAWQFRQYTVHPVRAYAVGDVAVPFSPDPACGASVVDIENQATANLYNYTPYQPNDAALADLRGEGDRCSSHGNLNFWLLYSKWFGDPLTEPFPTIFGPCANIEGGVACRAPEWTFTGA